MSRIFYPKLAAGNLKKNRRTYFPYLLTCIVSIVMFYTLLSVSTNPGLDHMPGSASVKLILTLGTIVIGMFAVVLLFYTNSFLMKQRKRELGLYSILGMEKKHVAKTLFFETLYLALISLAAGLGLGILLSRLLFFLLVHMLNFSTALQFTLSLPGITATLILFSFIFLLTLLSNFWQIKAANPIQLLHGGQLGEKEPKTKWVLAILGLLSLGGGYTVALTVNNPLDALMLFFLAVVLVIFGTYALFTAGSIAILKLLRKNKKFYYRPQNFISVSGMIYRMKQNAVGLANICILSTMVLVVVSTTVSLFIGQEDILAARFPREITVTSQNGSQAKEQIAPLAAQAEQNSGAKAVNSYGYSYLPLACYRPDGTVWFSDAKDVPENDANYTCYCSVTLLTLEDFNRMQKSYELLGEGEALMYSSGPDYGLDTIAVGGEEFQIKKELSDSVLMKKQSRVIVADYYLIVKDEVVIEKVYAGFSGGEFPGLSYRYFCDLEGTARQKEQFAASLSQALSQATDGTRMESREQNRREWYSLYGSFLFLGVFLGAMFMMATVLIIYYKQISEGYDDHGRFEIMQKVGMSSREVKKTIRKQILMVFFLPLAGAAVHIAAAFNVISNLLMLFNLANTMLFLLCTLATVCIFALAYALVYLITARTYYKLVERR